MPKLTQHNPQKVVKALLIGTQGSGKTGSLASLVKAGFRLFILDFDNGLAILDNLLNPEEAENVYFKTFTDRFKGTQMGPIVIGQPKAFSSAMLSLDNWKEEEESLGGVESWGSNTVVVIDSLTLLGEAIMRHTLMTEGRLNQNPWQQDWLTAMNKQESLLGMLYSESVQCHVLVLSHIKYIEDNSVPQTDDDTVKIMQAHPSALGSKLPPKVGSYFNTILHVKTQGTRRIIQTVPSGLIPIKVPVKLPSSQLPIETGMATYFAAMGAKPNRE